MSYLTKAIRFWIAIAFIGLYAGCIMGPPAVRALHATDYIHLADDSHQHADGVPNQHKHLGLIDPLDEHQLWSVPVVIFDFTVPAGSSVTRFAAMQDLTGLPPDGLIRPPIVRS